MSLEQKNKLQTLQYASPNISLTLPDWEEVISSILRVKAALVLTRNTMQDYLDFAVLAHHLGDEPFIKAMTHFDRLYPQAESESALKKLQVRLMSPSPYDLGSLYSVESSRLIERRDDWKSVKIVCASCAVLLNNFF